MDRLTAREGPPSDDVLIAFDQGLLSPEQIDAVTRWLEAHPEGEDRLRRLVEGRSDYAVAALQQPPPTEKEFAPLTQLTQDVVNRVLSRPAAALAEPPTIREYQLRRTLGQGGMGSVYLARHMRLQRDVALKLLRRELTTDPTYRRRFEREMAIVGQLDHPNLVRAYDAGAEGEQLFLVMELLEGQNLDELVKHRGPLPVADACELIRQAALGLHDAHEHGLVHRDVKPANLFLTSAGTVKVIDLGLARASDPRLAAERMSAVQTVIGTPDWMAPEQFERSTVDRRADLYALGCTLFLLLTGRPPFTSQVENAFVGLAVAHQMLPPPLLSDACPQAPAELTALIARLLAKEPAQRPATALEVAVGLEPFAYGHSLPARPSADVTPLLWPARTRPRNRRRWFLAAGALLAALGVTAWWTAHRSTVDLPERTPTGQATHAAELTPVVLKPVRTLSQHTSGVVSVAFSPDGTVLASGGKDRTILLWDTKTWQARGPLKGHTGEVIALAFAPDGSELASVTSANDTCTIRLWDVANARATGTLGGAWYGMFALAYSPNGKTLACGGWDSEAHLWNRATGKEDLVLRKVTSRHLRAVSFSPDGKRLATGGSGPTRLWDVQTGKEIPSNLPDEMCPTFLPDGDTLAGWLYGEGRVSLCTVPSGPIRATWRAHPKAIEGLAVSPDGHFLVSVGEEGLAYLWATADGGKVATLKGHDGSVYAAAFAPDGSRLATAGSEDGTVRLWELPALCRVRK